MTIERWHIWILALPLLLVGWIGTLAGVMALSEDAPAALVLFPSRAFLNALPQETAILSRSGFSVTLASDQPGMARALYHAGAWLVLPAGLTGCSRI